MERKGDEVPMLIAQDGPLNGKRWALRNSLIIGRESTCDIVVPERQVSRRHARVIHTTDGYLLEDLGSKNGSTWNGVPLNAPVKLRDGDSFQIALVQVFSFLSSDATLPLEGGEHELASQSAGRLRVDKRSHRVWIVEEEVLPPLSMSQFKMLEILFDHRGQVVSRQKLIEIIWGTDEAINVTDQALDAMIRRLRDRLNAVDPHHNYIVTVRGHGLRLDNPSE